MDPSSTTSALPQTPSRGKKRAASELGDHDARSGGSPFNWRSQKQISNGNSAEGRNASVLGEAEERSFKRNRRSGAGCQCKSRRVRFFNQQLLAANSTEATLDDEDTETEAEPIGTPFSLPVRPLVVIPGKPETMYNSQAQDAPPYTEDVDYINCGVGEAASMPTALEPLGGFVSAESINNHATNHGEDDMAVVEH